MSSPDSAEITKLPGYFPSVTPTCKKAAAPFFFCLMSKSEKLASNDSAAARRGLSECQTELREYMACMEKS